LQAAIRRATAAAALRQQEEATKEAKRE
jgi:hypothetical protein